VSRKLPDIRRFFTRLFQSWHGSAAVGALIVIVFVIWALPRQVAYVVPVDGSESWKKDSAPPRQQVVWKKPESLDDLIPQEGDVRELVTPRLADHGSTLYLARRDKSGQSDLFRSRNVSGQWSQAEPLDALNSAADELGPVLSLDGRQLFFYSNRKGGLGGYDLYVADRMDEGWSEPVNLGSTVNSKADEFEPAIAPDGLTLFYASDRAERNPQAEAKQKKNDRPAWTTTLRFRRRASTFDLYMAHRDAAEDDWKKSTPLSDLNHPRINDGAPFVSPNGAYLYFASDRPARQGEAPNLDLYRARWRGDHFEEAVNLGPTLNTSAHETEPALSPEGYTLVFSSDRDGHDRLYLSRVEEVDFQTSWDTSHLGVLGRFWWLGLLSVIVIICVAALFMYYRGHFSDAAYRARFFLGSVMVNLAVLLLLAYWTLPESVKQQLLEIIVSSPVTDPTEDPNEPSEDDGRTAVDVADLPAVTKQDVPTTERRTTEVAAVPTRTETLVPTIPIEKARSLPPERVIFEPQPRTTPTPELKQLVRTIITPSTQPMELVEQTDPLLTTQAPAAEPQVKPSTNPIARTEPLPTPQPKLDRPQPKIPLVSRSLPKPIDQPIDLDTESPQINPPTPTRTLVRAPSPTLPNQLVDDLSENPATKATTTAPATASVIAPAKTTLARTDVPTPSPRTIPRTMAKLPSAVQPRVTELLPSLDSPVPPVEVGTAVKSPLELAERTPVPIAGVASVTEEVAATEATTSVLAEFQAKPSKVDVSRATPITPPRGLGPRVDLPRQPATTSSAATVSVVALTDTNIETTIAATDSPLATRERQGLPREAAVAEVPAAVDLDSLATTTLNKNSTSSPQANPVQIDRQAAVGVSPSRPSTDSAANLVAAASPSDAPTVPVETPTPTSQGSVKPMNSPLAKTGPTSAIPSSTTDAELGAELQLSAVTSQVESELLGTEAILDRKTGITPDIDVRTPPRLTGRIDPAATRMEVGLVADESNNLPPKLGPVISTLARSTAQATNLAALPDKFGLKALLTLRQGSTRKEFIEILGGTKDSEEAVNRGLAWLAAHQNADGSWSLHAFHKNCKGKHANCSHVGSVNSDTAGTGLALLPFLAAGHKPKSGQYQKTVAAGVKWLVDHQKPDGDLFVPGNKQTWMYSHGIASIAICEAYAMAEDPALRVSARKSLDFIIKSQHQSSGGWRYGPNQSGDTSVVGWQMMALKSGEMAGLTVPKKTTDNVARWLKRVESNKPTGGLFGYTGPGPKVAMTAEGLLCLQFMGVERNDPRMLAGADYLASHLPDLKQQDTSYAWYYGSQVMYHMQGKYWEKWNGAIRDLLVNSQEKNGRMAGTWKPRDQWESSGGRLYATAMKVLMLEVYYRHMPLYDQLND
jgi:hypothetical protein